MVTEQPRFAHHERRGAWLRRNEHDRVVLLGDPAVMRPKAIERDHSVPLAGRRPIRKVAQNEVDRPIGEGRQDLKAVAKAKVDHRGNPPVSDGSTIPTDVPSMWTGVGQAKKNEAFGTLASRSKSPRGGGAGKDTCGACFWKPSARRSNWFTLYISKIGRAHV